MPTLPVPPGVHPDDGGDAAHRRLPAPTVVAPVAAGRDAAGLGAAVPGPAVPDPAVPWALTIAVGLVVAVLAGALGGLLVTGHRVPDGAAVLAVAALVLVPAVLVARAPRRAAASVAAVVGCAVLAVGLHPVLVALTAPPGTAARADGHAPHHVAEAVEAAGPDPVAAVAGGTAGRAQDDAADRDGGTTRDRAGPGARATDGDARGPAVDPSTGRTLVLRIAAGSVTGVLAAVLLVRAGRASHRPGGDPGRAATS
ncbi:hypothetical protein [Cellulomonas sp. B6]|uniref:hypothetical protein n=1 Tax=Cellulomonas sp. B6 TaxID=1295626 RepID=UPI0012378953|nr:hypothetical protein [Cellulomonas sp. B6]